MTEPCRLANSCATSHRLCSPLGKAAAPSEASQAVAGSWSVTIFGHASNAACSLLNCAVGAVKSQSPLTGNGSFPAFEKGTFLSCNCQPLAEGVLIMPSPIALILSLSLILLHLFLRVCTRFSVWLIWISLLLKHAEIHFATITSLHSQVEGCHP